MDLEEVAQAGYLSPKAVFVDGTHIKANANTKKQVKVQIPAASKHQAKELMEEVNADREAHGKKPFDDDDDKLPAPTKKRRDNTSKKKLANWLGRRIFPLSLLSSSGLYTPETRLMLDA